MASLSPIDGPDQADDFAFIKKKPKARGKLMKERGAKLLERVLALALKAHHGQRDKALRRLAKYHRAWKRAHEVLEQKEDG